MGAVELQKSQPYHDQKSWFFYEMEVMVNCWNIRVRLAMIVLSIKDKLNYIEQPIPPAPVAPAEPLHAHEMLKELKTMFAQQAGQELLQTMRDFHFCRQEEGNLYVLKMKGYIDNLERLGYPVTLGLGTVNELHAMLKLHEQAMSKSNAPALNAIQAGKVQKEPLHAHEMLKELKTMFAQQAGQELLQTTRDFHSCRQEEGQSVSLYILKMKGYIDNLERLGYPVTLGLGTVNELHAMLKLHEQTLSKSNAPALNAIQVGKVQKGNKHKKSHSQTVAKGQNHGKGKNKQAYTPKPKIPPPPKMENPAKNFICHECGEIGHWKRNCPYTIYAVSNKRAKLDLDSALLWHCRPRHISKKCIEKLQHDRLLDSSVLRAFEKCVSFMSGKMARKPYTHQVERAKDLLGLIHTDVCGPFKIMPRQGASYFITFTDDFSRYGYVYLLKHKHEVFETFKVFQKEVENQLGKTIKSLRSDCGGEYMSQEFLDHLKDYRIIAYRTPHYTLPHNDVSERRNRTLLDMVRFMMSQTTLPKSFWDYALETDARILNMVLTKKVEKIPYEVWSTRTRRAPDRMCLYIDAGEHELGNLGEPANYKAALLDPESEKWLHAMNVEMQSMKDNKVWVLVELPPNGKTIGSNWLFKKKTDMDGNFYSTHDTSIGARLVLVSSIELHGDS
nr:retrotransposon protein, putative, Ty1-copia subclass [Tanacetum cinerariifolium]